jgi:hypothetical protein
MKRLGGFILSVTLFALALGTVAVLEPLSAGSEVTTNTTFAPLGSCIHGDCLSNRSNSPLAFSDIYTNSPPFSKSLVHPALAYVYAGASTKNAMQTDVQRPDKVSRIAVNTVTK